MLLCVAFASNHVYDPFTKALLLTIAIMIGCPVVTAILAARRQPEL